MSRSLNKVTLIGNLGNDPEVRSTTGGNRVATFSHLRLQAVRANRAHEFLHAHVFSGPEPL